MSQFDEHIFQMGWNHQLVVVVFEAVVLSSLLGWFKFVGTRPEVYKRPEFVTGFALAYREDEGYDLMIGSWSNYLEPNWPLFLKVNPPKPGPFQSKQGAPFGFQVFYSDDIWLWILLNITLLGTNISQGIFESMKNFPFPKDMSVFLEGILGGSSQLVSS